MAPYFTTLLFNVSLITLCLLCLSSAKPSRASECRCFPGDSCWPSAAAWSEFNSSIGGRLIATPPLGAPCHDPVYNAAVCSSLQQHWTEPAQQHVSALCMQFTESLPSPAMNHRPPSWHPSLPTEAAIRSRQSRILACWGTMSITP